MLFYWLYSSLIFGLVVYMAHEPTAPWQPVPPRPIPKPAPVPEAGVGGVAVYCDTDPPAVRWAAYTVSPDNAVTLLGRYPSPLWAVQSCRAAGVVGNVELLSWSEDAAF